MADGTRELTDDELAEYYDAIYGGDIDTAEQDAIRADPDFEARAAAATFDPDSFIEWDARAEERFELAELEHYAT